MIRILNICLGLYLLVGCMSDRNQMNPSNYIESGYVNVSGGRLYYESLGSGNAIIFIHGNAGDRRHWDGQFEALLTDHRVIRYDVRGYGKSSLPMRDQPYSNHRDLAELLDHLAIDRAHVAGWSMGSGIAFDFALAFPERTISLISVGPWVNGYASASAQDFYSDFSEFAAVLAEEGLEQAANAWMKIPFFANTVIDSTVADRFKTIAEDYSFWAFTHDSPIEGLMPVASNRVHEISIPTLIMTAQKDIPACQEIAEFLNETIDDSEKVVMEGAGHLMHMEKPELFNQHLRNFVTRIERGSI
jgi:pimeloyl-ACP methyl ester carboxylesterase